MALPTNIKERFARALEKGTLAHAYLFTGLEGAGMQENLLEFAGLVLKTPVENLALHPDFFMTMRQEPASEISIDAVRALKNRLSLTSALGGWRVAILEDVELLNREAASALLKILEEPGEKVVLILSASRYGGVLATIRSRAIRITLPTEKMSSQELIPADVAEELKGIFEKLPKASYAERFKIAEAYAKDDIKRQSLLRYAASRVRAELSGIADGKSISPKGLQRARALLRTDAMLTYTNASPRLLLDVLLMNM